MPVPSFTPLIPPPPDARVDVDEAGIVPVSVPVHEAFVTLLKVEGLWRLASDVDSGCEWFHSAYSGTEEIVEAMRHYDRDSYNPVRSGDGDYLVFVFDPARVQEGFLAEAVCFHRVLIHHPPV